MVAWPNDMNRCPSITAVEARMGRPPFKYNPELNGVMSIENQIDTIPIRRRARKPLPAELYPKKEEGVIE